MPKINSGNIKLQKQMIQERKRIKSYNEMLEAYQNSCNTITNRYSQEIGKLTEESIKALCSMFQSYLSRKEVVVEGCQNAKAQSTQQSSNKNPHVGTSKIYEEDSFFCPTSIKKKKSGPGKENELMLSKQMKKMSLSSKEEQLIEDSEEDEDSPTRKFELKNQPFSKSLAQMIMESEKKVQRKAEERLDGSSASEYAMTDYSSNESSNEGSYSAYYAEEAENKPLFGGLFSKTMSGCSNNSSSSGSNLLNFNFSSKELLKSPKKVPKKKRLFVGNKKIPRWAEDLGKIEEQCQKQKGQGVEVFGRCVVEHLDTNIMFKGRKEGIVRTSSAKWNSRMFQT